MSLYICDRASYRITHREYTDEGFLRVPGNVARIGIQDYLARELKLLGDPNRVVKVYRPPNEVFTPDSLSSYDAVDVTVNHPDGLVNSTNYKKVTVGVVRGIGRQNGDYVQCDLIIKDKSAIDAINSGKCELSAGYTSIYDNSPGVTPDGEPYEFIQRNIRINHVALVDRARAGSGARVFDHSNGGVMPVIITTDSGRSVDVADPNNAQLVADSFERLTKRAVEAESRAEQAQATADATAEKLEEARKLTSDSAIAARVKLIATVQASAARVAGKTLTCDSMDTVEIMRSALAVARPKIDWADKSAAYVQAAFDAKMEEIEEEEEELEKSKDAGGEGRTRKAKDAGGEGRTRSVGDSDFVRQLAQLAQDAASGVNQKSAEPVMSRAQASLAKRTGKGS